MVACLGDRQKFTEIERGETISGSSRIEIEERLALNEMKIWTTLE